jgi:hypothetical protein
MVRSSLQSSTRNSGVNRISNSLTDREMRLIGQAVLEHLRQESAYLDSVIACSLKMSELLRHSSYASQTKEGELPGSREEKEKATLDQLHEMRAGLNVAYAPIAVGRDALHLAIQKLKADAVDAPSLQDLASELEGPVKDELIQLRGEIREKLQDVQSITLGNQAVLIYTLDFYHRLMMGISGDSAIAPAYNAHGQKTQQLTAHLVEKQC